MLTYVYIKFTGLLEFGKLNIFSKQESALLAVFDYVYGTQCIFKFYLKLTQTIVNV